MAGCVLTLRVYPCPRGSQAKRGRRSDFSLMCANPINQCARLPEKDSGLPACAHAMIWITNLTPQFAIKGRNWQNGPVGAKRP